MPRRDEWTDRSWLICPTTGKRGYLHRREARRAARRTDDGMSHYLCDDCHRWHTGHSTAAQRAAWRTRPPEMPEGFYDALRGGLARARQEEDEKHD